MEAGAPENRSNGSNSNQSSQNNVTKTFASAVNSRPKDAQAIVLDAIERITIDDYIDGLETIIPTSDIKYISKIFGGRVCVYLTNNVQVDNLTGKKVQVKDYVLTIRPFVGKNKRVVISNVRPFIPNEVLLDALKIIGISPVSQVSDIRARLTKPGRSHILLFRRQIYIREEDERLLPNSIQINHENTNYWIYLSTDSTCCYDCKQPGHVAKLCPNRAHVTPNEPTTINNSMELTETLEIQSTSAQENSNKTLKRPPPPSTSSECSSIITNPLHEEALANLNENPKENDGFIKPRTKKAKKLKQETQTDDQANKEKISKNMEKALEPAKKIIGDQSLRHVLDYNAFKLFLETTHGRSDIQNIANTFTNNTNGLIQEMDAVYRVLEDSTMKARFTRIKKKLLSESVSDTGSESDYSATSTS